MQTQAASASPAQTTTGRLEAAIEETLLNANVGDQPTDRDTLGFSPYVRAIADFLVNPLTRPPLTMSIEGEWGSGKSSFMRQLQRELHNRQRRANAALLLKEARSMPLPMRLLMRRPLRTFGARFIGRRLIRWMAILDRGTRDALRANQPFTVEFNAWRHDKEDALWAAFALHFHDKLAGQLPFPLRMLARFQLLWMRFNWRQGWFDVLRVAGLMVLFAVVTIAALIVFRDPQGVDVLLDAKRWQEVFNRYLTSGGLFSAVAFATLILVKLKDLFGNPLAVDLKKHLTSPDYASRVAFIEKFHEDFSRVVEAYAGNNKVFVFIDDLDRCEVPKAADLMQALNLMISDARQLIFLIGMDREKVAAGLAVKHEKLLPYLAPSSPGPDGKPAPDPTRGLEYGYSFIEKFIQVPFLVPQPTLMNFDKLYVAERPRAKAKKPGGWRKFLRWNRSRKRDGGAIKAEARLLPSAINNQIEVPAPRQTPAPVVAPAVETAMTEAPLTEAQRKRRQFIRPKIAEDKQTLESVIPLVARALDNNPRRLKQFINLFRLRGLIALETGLFDLVEGQELSQRLTRQKLAKFVALSLKWPLLLNLLEERPDALAEMQMVALGQKTLPEIADPRVRRWAERGHLINFWRVGCYDEKGDFDEKGAARCGFIGLNIGMLLQVSPAVERPRFPPEDETQPDPVEEAAPDETGGNWRARAQELFEMGENYLLTGNLEQALRRYEESVSLALNNNDAQLAYQISMNAGTRLLEMGYSALAHDRFVSALAVARSLGRQEDVVTTLLKLGEIDRRMGRAEEAYSHLEEALSLARSLSGPASEIQVLLQLGETFLDSGEARRAMEYFDQALEAAKRYGDGPTIANVLLRYGAAMERAGDLSLAISQTSAAVNLLTELNHPSLPQAREQLERLQKQMPA